MRPALRLILDVQRKLNLRELFLLVVRGLVDGAHLRCAMADQRDEPEPVSDELVVQHGGVDLKVHEVDGDGRHPRDDGAPQSVRNARVCVAEDKLAFLIVHGTQPHVRSPHSS